MPSISIGEGERQGAQKNLPRQREVRELLQSDGLYVVELQGIHLETTGLGDELDGARAFGGVGVGAQHLVATVDVDLHGAAIHEHAQVQLAGGQFGVATKLIRTKQIPAEIGSTTTRPIWPS